MRGDRFKINGKICLGSTARPLTAKPEWSGKITICDMDRLNGRCWSTWFINVAPAQKPGYNVVVAIIRTLAANWLGNCAERWWEMLTNELRHCLSNGLVAFLLMLSNMSISDLVVFVFNDSLVAGQHFSHVSWLKSFIQWPRFSFHFYITEEIVDMWFPPHFFLPLWQCLQQFLYKSQNSSTKVSN